MCATDKVTLVDTMDGANLTALAAGYALLIVYNSEIVHDVTSVLGTASLALAAGNTAVKTELAHYGTLIVVRAFHHNARGVAKEVDNAVGTGTHAQTATYALTLVNNRDASLGYLDSILGTNGNTVTVAEAGEGTGAVATVEKICRTTALGACRIVVFSILPVTHTVTGDVCHHLDNVLSLNAEDRRDFPCGAITAGGAEVRFFALTLGKCCGIAVTARVAAGAAVSTGEALADSDLALVNLHGEEHRSNREKHGTEKTDSKECYYGNQYFHTLPP